MEMLQWLSVFFSHVEQFGELDESERRTEEYDTLVRHNRLLMFNMINQTTLLLDNRGCLYLDALTLCSSLQAMKYLSYLLYPMCMGGAVYALIFLRYKRSVFGCSMHNFHNVMTKVMPISLTNHLLLFLVLVGTRG